jgi:hypothetical protein
MTKRISRVEFLLNFKETAEFVLALKVMKSAAFDKKTALLVVAGGIRITSRPVMSYGREVN